ncbi:hypothetical protein [Ruminococcus sp. CAG:330]|uniref:hypothetical protein n=1 Tax=Ruminococcus sp. CAG:330 TaxID=1262954 RepID=UPI000A541903|nr:hypothetical protein [Ruminococcus sp. CAG:330]
MAYFYRWQYCDMDFLRHCLKQYSLLLEKIPSAILTEETTGTQMFVTGYFSDCIKRCDDGFDDYTMTALLPEGTASVTLQGNGWTIRRLSTRYHGKYAALLPEIAAYYFSKAGRQRRRDTEQALGSRCFAFFDYAYNRMLETQFLRHDFRWVGGEIPSVNHLKTLSDAADLTEALGQFRREEYGRRKKHDLSHAKLCTFLETQFGILYFENRSASYLLQPVSGGFSADDGSTESWLLWRCNRLLGGIALTAERKVCRLFGTDENDRQQVLAAYFCFCRQKGILFSGEMQLCQPEYPEPLGKDFLPWKWESGKVTPQLLQTIADQLRQCAPEQAADWCWLLGTRLVFTVLPLAKKALAALPQPEQDAFFVQSPFHGESPLSGEPHLLHFMLLRNLNQHILGISFVPVSECEIPAQRAPRSSRGWCRSDGTGSADTPPAPAHPLVPAARIRQWRCCKGQRCVPVRRKSRPPHGAESGR